MVVVGFCFAGMKYAGVLSTQFRLRTWRGATARERDIMAGAASRRELAESGSGIWGRAIKFTNAIRSPYAKKKFSSASS